MKEIQPEKAERGWLGRGQFKEVVREGFSKEASVKMRRRSPARGRGSTSESKCRFLEDKTAPLFSEPEGKTERPLCRGEGGDGVIRCQRGGEVGRQGARVKNRALRAAWEAIGSFTHRSDTTKCIHSFHTYEQRAHSVPGGALWSGARGPGEGRIW